MIMCIGTAPKTTVLNEISLVDKTFMWKLLLFHTEMISAYFLWGNVLLGGDLQIDAKNTNFEISERALYMKSRSMPLTDYNKVRLY